MGYLDAFMPDFDQEMANTRNTLDRLPADNLTWRPHPRSWNMAELATHIAVIPGWIAMILESDTFDVAPGGRPADEVTPGETREQIMDLLRSNVAQARQALQTAAEDVFAQSWSLLAGGKPLFTMPRSGVLRGMVLHHLIHHRGQLLVYLRLNDIPLPSIYGPSADEGQI